MIRNPNRTMRTARFTATPFPGNIIPANRINPTSTKFLEFYPAPNLPDSHTRFATTRSRKAGPINKDQFILRMDFIESSNSQWFGRYSWGDENLLNESSVSERIPGADQRRAVHGLERACLESRRW